MPCNRQFGCHGCVIEQAREKLWTLRQALSQFLQLPNGKEEAIKTHALSLKREIDELITSNFREEEKEETS
jgi:hypothetical protein